MAASTTNGTAAQNHPTRDKLIEVGITLFSNYGFEATTTRMISEAAGVNNAAVFFHFGSKEKFYTEVLNTVAARMTRTYEPLRMEIDQARQGGAFTSEQAWYYIERYIDFFLDIIRNRGNDEVLYLLLHEQLTPAESGRPITRAICQVGEQMLQQLLLEFWGVNDRNAAVIASRLSIGGLAALVEHPTFAQIALGLDASAELPEEAWRNIRAYVLNSLRTFTPSMLEETSGQSKSECGRADTPV